MKAHESNLSWSSLISTARGGTYSHRRLEQRRYDQRGNEDDGDGRYCKCDRIVEEVLSVAAKHHPNLPGEPTLGAILKA